jgi:hypothetical protein
MPRGPKGEKRPADVIANAVHVMRIATGDIAEDFGKAPKRARQGRSQKWQSTGKSNIAKLPELVQRPQY